MLRATAVHLLLTLLLCAPATSARAEPLYQHLRLIAPAAPGGGWDQTARVMQLALQSAGIVHTSSVENIPGAAGTIGTGRMPVANPIPRLSGQPHGFPSNSASVGSVCGPFSVQTAYFAGYIETPAYSPLALRM